MQICNVDLHACGANDVYCLNAKLVYVCICVVYAVLSTQPIRRTFTRPRAVRCGDSTLSSWSLSAVVHAPRGVGRFGRFETTFNLAFHRMLNVQMCDRCAIINSLRSNVGNDLSPSVRETPRGRATIEQHGEDTANTHLLKRAHVNCRRRRLCLVESPSHSFSFVSACVCARALFVF